MGLMAVFALHVHTEMDLVLADLWRAPMATQAVFTAGLNLARRVRLVALVAVKLHGRCLGVLDLSRLLNDRWIGCKEPHIHGSILFQLLADILIRAVAVEAL